MASIALSVVRCIDYLAYGSIFTRAMFLPKKKGDVFFPARKAVDACREVVAQRTSWAFSAGTKIIPATKESYRVYIGTGNQNSNIDSV